MIYGLHVERAEISAFVCSTENGDSVRKAIMSILPKQIAEVPAISTQQLRGHYNDMITIMKTELRKDADTLLSHIVRSLSTIDRTGLLDELDSRTDESGNLYLRLNKQKAFLGYIELSDSDPIRIKLKFRATGKHLTTGQLRDALVKLAEEKQTNETAQ